MKILIECFRNPNVIHWIKVIIIILLLIVSLVNGGDTDVLIKVLLDIV